MLLRIRHLLSMSTGHDKDTTESLWADTTGEWIKTFLALPVEHAPGTHFVYNSGATYMLAAVVQKLTGMTLVDYLKPRLFEPLGIANPTWDTSAQGINFGGWASTSRPKISPALARCTCKKGSMQAGASSARRGWQRLLPNT